MAPPESSHHHHHNLLESGLLDAGMSPSAAADEKEETSTGRKKSEASLRPRRWPGLRRAAAQLQEVFLGTKLFPLFSAVPLAVAAESLRLGRAWVFAFSLIGLAPLAEPGGLLNATCGNVPELIIALFALHKNEMEILKWSLLGSILSNLLLVLGSSLLFGGIANIGKERPLDKRQADVSIGLLLLGVLCHVATLVFKYTSYTGDSINLSSSVLQLSRSSAIVMLIAYFGSLLFQLKTHRQIFEVEEDCSESSSSEDDNSVIGFASAVVWLIGMAAVIAMLSNYVVTTIEIPVIMIVSWVNGIPMDLDFNLLETGSFVMTVIITAFTLQNDKWHYLKGFNLVLCYIVIAVCFFIMKALPSFST
uniref:Sodium/calcium exchanger membrane region domain-containing protein n=1 Tax=Leersia perrieri TaxID=77586 RepID=A0A0D9VFA8_9ORYZ